MRFRKKITWFHFPYQSYDYVIRFLTEAANDPNVEAIHATQYRVAANSAVVKCYDFGCTKWEEGLRICGN